MLDREEFVAYYREHTRKETAIRFGITPATVKTRAKKYGCGKDIRKPRPDRAEFECLYQTLTMTQLAVHYSVPERRIQHWAKTWDIKKPVKRVEKEELLSYYSQHTLEETADHFDISVSYVVQLVREYGFKKTAEMIYQSATIPLPSDIPAFIEYFSTHTYEDTAIKYQVSKNTIGKWRHELKISDKQPEQWLAYRVVPDRSFELPDRQEFERVYNEFSNDEAAKYFGVNPSLICKWREMLGVQRKTSIWKDLIDQQLTHRQKSIVSGSLLGDGGLKRVNENSNSSFCEVHGEDQEHYLRWKYDELLPFSSTFTKRVGNGKLRLLDGKVIEDESKVSIGYALNTIAHPIFTNMEREWYARDSHGSYILDNKGWRIKIVPESVELDELAIAVWYFDDGSHNRTTASGIVFNTQAFTVDECDMLRGKLARMGFTTNRSTNRGKPIISLAAKSYLEFMEMVSPHLPHDCLYRKIDISNYNFDKGPPARKLSKDDIEKVMQMLDEVPSGSPPA